MDVRDRWKWKGFSVGVAIRQFTTTTTRNMDILRRCKVLSSYSYQLIPVSLTKYFFFLRLL
jgi:hypothetical protein